MTLRVEFDQYLAHLGATIPVSVLHKYPEAPGLCALRHDIDHDIDVALEMAHREHQVGARATYFILPTAPYWDDPRLIDKCLQLQDYGHELGLHVNCMAQWVGGETDDPEKTLRDQINRLRSGGVDVAGISAHGDRRCYENNISNYWCFQELRPIDPLAEESGRTAEGLTAADSRYRLNYPKNDTLIRPDGACYPLWSISMAKLGLEYHAWHVPHDRYFSDSGGNWTRTSDPLEQERGNDRWQVLIHPIHWRAEGRRYFFLSTARAGSRWLSEALNQATPLTARHEYILNQDYHRGETSYKTTANFRSLEDNPKLVHDRLLEAWEELDQMSEDYAEVNVYLPTFVDELRRIFPGAKFIHLHRHPAQVVRSLMDRDWYDTPEDHAHPCLTKADASKLNQFERVCQYVAETNERLLQVCDERIGLEELTRNTESLQSVMHRLGIPFHSRLGSHLCKTVINDSKRHDFKQPEQWTLDQIFTYQRLIGGIAQTLGYASPKRNIVRSLLLRLFSFLNRDKPQLNGHEERESHKQMPIETELNVDNARIKGFNCDVIREHDCISIRPHGGGKHAYVTLGGSSWRETANEMQHRSGWAVVPNTYLKGIVGVEFEGNGSLSVFAISYGIDGKKIYQRRLGVLNAKHLSLSFSFSLHPDAAAFDIAIYASADQELDQFSMNDYRLRNVGISKPSPGSRSPEIG